MPRVLAILCVLLSFAGSANARPSQDVVVVAELLRASKVPGHCGVLAVVGEYEFRVLKVEQGELHEDRIIVEALCPEMSMQNFHLSRLRLSTERKHIHQPGHRLSNPPSRRLFLRRQEAFDFDYTAVLGMSRKALDARFTNTAEAAERWLEYGPGLQVQLDGDQVSKVRLPCPRGFPRAFPAFGIPSPTWQRYRRRGGYAQGPFSTSNGIVGEVRRGVITFKRAPLPGT